MTGYIRLSILIFSEKKDFLREVLFFYVKIRIGVHLKNKKEIKMQYEIEIITHTNLNWWCKKPRKQPIQLELFWYEGLLWCYWNDTAESRYIRALNYIRRYFEKSS